MPVELSPVQPGPCMCGTEATYGVQPVTFAPPTQGFLTEASVNPFTPDLQYVEFIPHTDSFALEKDIPTFKMAQVRARFRLQGGTSAVLPPRFAPMWKCAGVKETIAANIVYKQALRTELTGTTFAFQIPGKTNNYVHEVNGLIGNNVITGSAREGIYSDFTGTGLYQHPQEGSLTSVYTGVWSGGTNSANKFILSGANRISVNDGAGAYFGVVKRVEFNLGAEPSPITDINSGATFGIYSIEHGRFRPTLVIDFGTDVDPTSLVDLKDFYEDADDGTLHNITWTYSDLAARTLAFSFPTAQVRTVTYAEDENVRVTRVTYKLQGTVPWQITHA